MAADKLLELVRDLAARIANNRSQARNEEWTKVNLILRLLNGLGWGEADDLFPEDKPSGSEERLDYILDGPPKVGVEAKALGIVAPRDPGHDQVRKGLRQSNERDASYFVWTDGDRWQFYSLAVEGAPVYEVRVSDAAENPARVVAAFRIIEKKTFVSDPHRFEEAIRENWKATVVPAALDRAIESHGAELVQLLRKTLPPSLDVSDEEILKALAGRGPTPESRAAVGRGGGRPERRHTFPEDWTHLLDSPDEPYSRAREKFSDPLNRALGLYLCGESYRRWSKQTTWRILKLRDEPNQRKRSGNVIQLYLEWNFIALVDERFYERVGKGLTHLKRLVETS